MERQQGRTQISDPLAPCGSFLSSGPNLEQSALQPPPVAWPRQFCREAMHLYPMGTCFSSSLGFSLPRPLVRRALYANFRVPLRAISWISVVNG